MVGERKVLRVFVASPGDVKAEREALEQSVQELNEVLCHSLDIHMDLIRYETHAWPGFGPDAQAVINEQLGDDYDIFIGILWKRFGTPTPRAESGTAEEFRIACSKWERDPNSVSVMIYFKQEAVRPDEIDPDQLAQVLGFRRTVADLGGLYWTFSTVDDFAGRLRIHLAREVRDWHEKLSEEGSGLVADTPPAETAEMAAGGTDSAEDEEGFLDLADQGTGSFELVSEIMGRLTEQTLMLTEQITQGTADLEAIGNVRGRGGITKAMRIVNRLAQHMEAYACRVRVEIPSFRDAYSNGIDMYGKATILLTDFGQDTTEEIQGALTNVRDLHEVIEASEAGVEGMREIIAQIPRITTHFNQAKRRCLAVLRDLLTEFTAARMLTLEVEELLRGLVD